MRGYPQFSFWILITLVKIYISCIIMNRGKNICELVGTVLKSLKPNLDIQTDSIRAKLFVNFHVSLYTLLIYYCSFSIYTLQF